jgi:hypothetical protein
MIIITNQVCDFNKNYSIVSSHSPNAAKRKRARITYSKMLHKQWSQYKENEVNKHCSFVERNVIPSLPRNLLPPDAV